MKNTHKKIIGGLLAGLFIATIGATLATGQTDDAQDDATSDITNDIPQKTPFRDRHGMMGPIPFGSELTDDQQTELQDLMTSLREQNATPEEMRTALQEKLDEFGILDTRLENEITRTEQRLTILNRQKVLRDEGYSWDEISGIIEDEFGLENATDIGWNMMGGHGFGHGPGRCPQEFIPFEESDQ